MIDQYNTLTVRIRGAEGGVKTCGAFFVQDFGGDIKSGYCLLLKAACIYFDYQKLNGGSVSLDLDEDPKKNLRTCAYGKVYLKGKSDSKLELEHIERVKKI